VSLLNPINHAFNQPKLPKMTRIKILASLLVIFGFIAGIKCTSAQTPAVSSVLMPQYISGNTPTNNRLPFAYRVTFSSLLPSATYRYINTVVTSTDNATSAGSGAIIFVHPDGTFTRSAVGSFTNPGEYGEFTTDAAGNYTGWFITEPTTNTRFTPGNQVFMRIRLNDGANGTIAQSYLTTTEPVTVLAFSAGSTANDGTGIRAASLASAGNFAMLYDNEAGTGRPLFGTSIESTGIDFSTLLYADFFRNFVAGTDGSWGGIIPNVNANGLRLVEERDITTGAVVNTNTSPDGMWGTVNTVNPSGGVTNVLVLDLIPDSQLFVDPASLNGFSYVVNNGPSLSQSYTLTGTDLIGSGNISVAAPAHYEVSTDNTNWSASLQLPFAGGVITGQTVTIHVRLKAGLPFGNYNNENIVHTGGTADPVNVTCSGNVLAPAAVIESEVVPQYIQGINGTNDQRVPYAYNVLIGDLIPGATYRYFNQAVLSTDLPDADGQGVAIYAAANGTFTRAENPSLSAGYGQFTASPDGTFNGWFILESNNDARFTPGNELFMRIMLNDGNNGTSAAHRLTTTAGAAVINFGTDADPDMGTGVRAISLSEPGNFVYLFDNAQGNGRPLYATTIETTGIDFTTAGGYAAFYASNVEGTDGSWGGIVPNILTSGIKRIEERSNNGCSLVTHWISEDGMWGATNTVNPDGGETDVLVIDLLPPPVPELTVSPSSLSDFTYLAGFGPSSSQSYSITGSALEGSGNITVTAPSTYEVSLNDTTYAASLDLPFANGIITGQPVLIYTRLKAGLTGGMQYNDTITHVGGGAAEVTVTLEGEVTLPPQPEITDLLLPFCIQGMNGTNENRVPFAFRATIINLQPSATYRYFNRVVLETDTPDYTGVGNPIYVNSDGTFSRTTGTSLGTPGQYGEFTTTADGTYSGWFMLEPTGNERFTAGNHLLMRIMINDGNNGTTVSNHITSPEFTTVLKFETEQDSTQGTAIRGTSDDMSGNFVFLYDNADAERPLYGTSIETTGIDYPSLGVYAPFYENIVSGTNGSWGGIVPNMNSSGIQAIKVFAQSDASLVSSYEMASGIWGVTDTRNPSGGVDEVLFINLSTINVKDHALPAAGISVRGEELVVEPLNNEPWSLDILSMQGKLINSIQGTGYTHLTPNVPAGIYVVKFRNNTGVYAQKVFLK